MASKHDVGLVGTTAARKLSLLSNNRECEVIQQRQFVVERATVNKESRTVDLSFSSEEPVKRWWGNEILDHSTGACDLSRLNSGGACLVNHDPDEQIGVVENARIEGGKGRCTVRFSKSADAEEIFQDVLDGIRRNASVSYEITEMHLESEKDGLETYRVAKWCPCEVSLVSIPADKTVGVGRNLNLNNDKKTMPEEIKTATPPDPKADIQAVRAEERQLEKKRRDDISALGKNHKRSADEVLQFIGEGKSAEEYRDLIMEQYRSAPAPKLNPNLGSIPLEEVKNFSFMRAIRALAFPQDKKVRDEAGFEFEVSEAAQKRFGRSSGGILIPPEVLAGKRASDLTAGTVGDGGYLKGTTHMGSEFIDILRAKMVLQRAGARVLSGLQGDIDIPKRTSGATAYWVAENNAPTDSANVYTQVTMAPNTVGAYVDISRRLMIQSDPSVEGLVRNDLATCIALAIDLSGLHGAGGSEPTGVAGVSGIGAVAIGTNGGYPEWDHIVDLETEVAQDDADVSAMAYITNPKVRGRLKKTLVAPTAGSAFLWQDGQTPGEGSLNGYRALVSTQVSSALTKGGSGAVCSAIFFGCWDQLIIGNWGGLDLLVDPYTGSAAGTTRIRVLQDVDIAVRYAQAFAATLDALTA